MVDLELSRRLELAEAFASRSFVETRVQMTPNSTASWREYSGALAMFDGPDSPLTQTFGLGIYEPPTHSQLEQIEDFYAQRDAATQHEISPLIAPESLSILNSRGYRPTEHTSILCRTLEKQSLPEAHQQNRIQVRIADTHEYELWANTCAAGWDSVPELTPFLREFGKVMAHAPCSFPFVAYVDEQPVATGVLHVCDRVALLAGASTIPIARKQGAQAALLSARLRYAADLGCDLAMMGALPGSPSQRNAQRNGFQIAYTRTKWMLARDHRG